jgi:hypothetical protein
MQKAQKGERNKTQDDPRQDDECRLGFYYYFIPNGRRRRRRRRCHRRVLVFFLFIFLLRIVPPSSFVASYFYLLINHEKKWPRWGRDIAHATVSHWPSVRPFPMQQL